MRVCQKTTSRSTGVGNIAYDQRGASSLNRFQPQRQWEILDHDVWLNFLNTNATSRSIR